MKVKLYTTHCPKCEILKKMLENKNINIDVVEDINIMIENGFSSIPMLEINGNVLNFKKAEEWIKNLR